jgi:prepilin-type N-terminal cleavage/methylation domain-containing protein
MRGNAKGFTLFELLIVIAIIAIVAAITILIIDPQESTAKGRDSSRMNDLDSLQKAINMALTNNPEDPDSVLCFNLTPPCSGNSSDQDSNSRNSDGSGFIRVNFSLLPAITIPTLPVDPINSGNYVYSYRSDGASYEINAILESRRFKIEMTKDGGNNDNVYELGTSLTLIN